MEHSLYGDQEYGIRDFTMENVQQLKRRLTLDLEQQPAGKRPRPSHLLTSPDLRMLKLASPELERLIAQQGGMVTTPTPGGPQAVSAVFGRPATEEQEDYARGFVDALHSLKQREDGGELVYTQLEGRAAAVAAAAAAAAGTVRVKEEPQRVPSAADGSDSPPPAPTSPVNMVQQEAIKLERKRHRNRIAATKCRLRKLERISRLEDRVSVIKSDNNELADVVNRLREQVAALNQEVREHTEHGCQIMYPQQQC